MLDVRLQRKGDCKSSLKQKSPLRFCARHLLTKCIDRVLCLFRLEMTQGEARCTLGLLHLFMGDRAAALEHVTSASEIYSHHLVTRAHTPYLGANEMRGMVIGDSTEPPWVSANRTAHG